MAVAYTYEKLLPNATAHCLGQCQNRNCGVETCPVTDLPAGLADTLDNNSKKKKEEEQHEDTSHMAAEDISESYLDFFR